MKRLWLLPLLALVFGLAGCQPAADEPPATNPTGEKPADDKAAAGASNATADPDAKQASTAPQTSKNEAEVKPASNAIMPGQPMKKDPDPTKGLEKPADDSTPVYKQDKDAGKGLPPPGTPIKK